MNPPVKPLQLLAIVTEQTGTFLSNAESGWRARHVSDLLFDGAVPEPTRRADWFKVAQVPTRVESVVAATVKHVGRKLREGFVASDRMPATLAFTTLDDTPYEGLSECYDFVSEPVPERREPVEFQLHVVAERSQWQPIKEEFPVTYGLLDQILVHPVLLPERPCKLSIQASYEIIREHIKRHINRVHAVISSDYDFCLTVTKIIKLAENEPYEATVGTKRRPHKETRYRTDRSVVIYETAPATYQSYTITRPFVGTSYEDLQANIKTFLDDLMARINEPVKDCPHCKGRGVIT